MEDRELWNRAAWIGAVPGSLIFAYMQVSGYIGAEMVGADSHAYWRAAHDLALPYDTAAGFVDAYLYSPAFAQMLWPIAQLGWPAFQVLWLTAQLLVAAWLVRGLSWWKGLVLVLFVAGEFVLGNVYIFFAALVILLVRRRGVSLAPLILTKVAPAVLGLWYVVHRDWRAVAQGAFATAVVLAVSVVADPAAWSRWLQFLLDSADSTQGTTAIARLVLAGLCVVLAAAVNRSALLPVAIILASPVLGGLTYFAVMLSLPRLVARDSHVRAVDSGAKKTEAPAPGRSQPDD